MANSALRTLCIAYKEIGVRDDLVTQDDKGVFDIEKSGLILVGVLGIKDILR
jgi:Ca2+ transporting ATPase